MKEYKTVLNHSQGVIVEKKSKFIANLVHIETPEEALAFLQEVKTKYWDARHNVYAYILNRDNIKKYSDDGEPQGTSGIPSLNVLEGEGLKDVCVIVTRYFGGTLLGTGGLARAYSDAVKKAVENSVIVRAVNGVCFSVTVDYAAWDKVISFCEKFGALLFDTEYSDIVKTLVLVFESKKDEFIKAITEKTDGKAVLTVSGNRIAYVDSNGCIVKYSS